MLARQVLVGQRALLFRGGAKEREERVAHRQRGGARRARRDRWLRIRVRFEAAAEVVGRRAGLLDDARRDAKLVLEQRNREVLRLRALLAQLVERLRQRFDRGEALLRPRLLLQQRVRALRRHCHDRPPAERADGGARRRGREERRGGRGHREEQKPHFLCEFSSRLRGRHEEEHAAATSANSLRGLEPSSRQL